jgi:hypothetical protein
VIWVNFGFQILIFLEYSLIFSEIDFENIKLCIKAPKFCKLKKFFFIIFRPYDYYLGRERQRNSVPSLLVVMKVTYRITVSRMFFYGLADNCDDIFFYLEYFHNLFLMFDTLISNSCISCTNQQLYILY